MTSTQRILEPVGQPAAKGLKSSALGLVASVVIGVPYDSQPGTSSTRFDPIEISPTPSDGLGPRNRAPRWMNASSAPASDCS